MIILDFGSGNTCRNDLAYVERMIRTLAEICSNKEDVIIKWQLFEDGGRNIPLVRTVFSHAYEIGNGYGFDTTASVMDIVSLNYLLRHDPLPFIKLANRPDSHALQSIIPDDIRIIKSVGKPEDFGPDCMCCVSKYPARKEQYEKTFKEEQLRQGISDHTTNWDLYNKYKPEIYEVHFCLEDSQGLDSGPFARRPIQLKEIL